MDSHIYVVLILKECLRSIAGDHFPNEIIKLIMLTYYQPIRVICGGNTQIISKGEYYVYRDRGRDSFFPGLYIECHSCYANASIKDNTLWIWKEHDKIMFDRWLHIKKISCGNQHMMVIDMNNNLYAYGKNFFGQLGLGDFEYRSTLNKVNLSDIELISCGSAHTIALTTSNQIYVWGCNFNRRLGLKDIYRCAIPILISLTHIINIYCGAEYTIALSKYNKLFVWGNNQRGQLGLGYTGHLDVCEPTELSLEHVISVSCGSDHTIALDKFGNIYGWGSNVGGRLGFEKSRKKFIFVPTKISLSKIMSISCGVDYTIVVTVHNEIYGWGCNSHNQLDSKDNKDKYTPCRITL